MIVLAVAERLDRAEGGGRHARPRDFWRVAPGSDSRHGGQARAHRSCSRTGCGATGREELFDERGALVPEIAALAPKGERRMGANPHANGGLLLGDLRLPDFRDYAVTVPTPGRSGRRSHARARRHFCATSCG